VSRYSCQARHHADPTLETSSNAISLEAYCVWAAAEMRRCSPGALLTRAGFAGVKAPVLFRLVYDNFAQLPLQDRETYLL